MKPRHFLDIDAFPRQTLRAILDDAHAMKALGRNSLPEKVKIRPGAVLAMIFEQPSTRTRVSFEVAMHELGGTSIMLSPADMQIGRGETIADTARVLSRYVDAIMIRTGSHGKLLELAAHATVPVINGLTNLTHPCQVMADVMTFEEKKGSIEGKTVAWLGDANNVATSWVHAAARFGFKLKLACPKQFRPAPELLAWAKAEGASVEVLQRSACRGQRRRLRGDRCLGLHGRRRGEEEAQGPAEAVPGRSRRDEGREARRHLHALPAGPSRRRGDAPT